MIQTNSEYGVVDRTGIPITSTIWYISTYAVSVWRCGPNWLKAGIPVLSTTHVPYFYIKTYHVMTPAPPLGEHNARGAQTEKIRTLNRERFDPECMTGLTSK